MNARGPRKGRGAGGNESGRFERFAREDCDDGWGILDEEPARLRTTLEVDSSRSVISYNESPDVPFDRSINPYRGCEHGCIYCYARPTHAWLGLSPGLDFESRLFYKPDAAAELRSELSRGRYRCAPIALGANTDAYQPVERRLEVTRGIVQVLHDCAHPLIIITKSALVERDLDLLGPMAERRLASVAVSITTLDHDVARRMEPRAAAPARRLRTIERLAAAGIEVTVLVAPVIPVLTDAELETILASAREAGAVDARYIFVRLPLEVSGLFREWLERHYPLKAAHVLARISDSRDGKDYVSGFGTRMRGTGHFADLLARRFALARERLAFPGRGELDCSAFRRPARDERQLALL
ncbi:MAG: PA0069 family radical SAM protein [Gammaproteobacteria bacterium]|nr:PA0069 family radical SAM protein [Gammaproteobacteria bacterium]